MGRLHFLTEQRLPISPSGASFLTSRPLLADVKSCRRRGLQHRSYRRRLEGYFRSSRREIFAESYGPGWSSGSPAPMACVC